MASTTITGLVELATSPATGDWFVVIDVSDTTQSPSGSTKKILTSNVFNAPTITSPTLSGTVAITGNVAVNTNKVTIAASTGNTVIAGTLAVGAATTVSFASATVTVNATSGNPAFVFQRASAQTALIASGAADEIDFLNAAGVSMGSWIAGAVSFAGNLVINTNKFTVAGSSGDTVIAGTITMSTAASRILPGATSLSLRNNANSADNLIILDAGAATFRTSVSSPSYLGAALALTGGITSSGPTGTGIGYATGAGGAVTQTTNRTAAVTLNKLTGAITTDTTSLSAGGAATFTVNNTTVVATDTIDLSIKGGAVGTTFAWVSTVAANSFAITLYCISGTETGAIVLNFAVVKAVTS